MVDRLDTPRDKKLSWFERRREAAGDDRFGSGAEAFARFMGTARFLVWMTLFCIVWLAWNSLAPVGLRFDKSANGFTALTLMLSLQASYAAPLILLAQNRQDDRDRVTADRDRIQAARNLADTEYLAREVAALRIALQEVATRDFLRSELRDLLEALEEPRRLQAPDPGLTHAEAADADHPVAAAPTLAAASAPASRNAGGASAPAGRNAGGASGDAGAADAPGVDEANLDSAGPAAPQGDGAKEGLDRGVQAPPGEAGPAGTAGK
ncbi:MAG: DUF1003 domain-containing protein [Bifidobacteriaceae bacterium]|jgi:uncharacterized membrane protein|nr:DUF1003 domain-containing protein [Bifidobacteriaceae bacterium]